MYFKDLAIGQTFDFVGPDSSDHVYYFFARCTKVSTSHYTWQHHDGTTLQSEVGSVYALVYHVEPVKQSPTPWARYLVGPSPRRRKGVGISLRRRAVPSTL